MLVLYILRTRFNIYGRCSGLPLKRIDIAAAKRCRYAGQRRIHARYFIPETLRMSSHHATNALPVANSTAAATTAPIKSDWRVIHSLLPYLWDFRWRVALALTLLITAKLANIGVPLLL